MDATVWTVIGMLGATLAVVLGLLFQLGGRIDALTIRIDGLSARIDALSARIDGLSARLDAHLEWHAGRRSS